MLYVRDAHAATVIRAVPRVLMNTRGVRLPRDVIVAIDSDLLCGRHRAFERPRRSTVAGGSVGARGNGCPSQASPSASTCGSAVYLRPMTDPLFANAISPEYAERRDSLIKSFPAAHRFLTALEHLHTSDPRHHLGTAQNVHVYVGDRFLCYIRIERQPPKGVVLVVRSEPHQGRIKDGTQSIDAPAFVNRVAMLIAGHHGYQGWGDRTGIEYTLDARTPEVFFDDFVGLVRGAVA